MINYLTTVQLIDAEQNDYDKLDIEMSKEEFAPVTQNRNIPKPLPSLYRVYEYRGGITLQEVTAAAYRASSRTGKKYSFTVIKDKT